MRKSYFKVKKESPQRIRKEWIDATLKLWSKLIRNRDNYTCQWCGSTNKPQAHHIVARGITAGCKMAWFDLDNGMTLCFNCHINKLKALPDEYIKFRDMWFKKITNNIGSTFDFYMVLRLKYSVVSKLPLDELKIIHGDLNRLCIKRGLE